MPEHSYIVGSRKEKDQIEKLLNSNAPAFVNYEFTDLCSDFHEQLRDKHVANSDEFDYALCDFLDEMETDIRERMGDWFTDYLPYLLDVEAAMYYFKKYMYTLGGMPVVPLVQFEKGTPLSVMKITLRFP